MRTTFLQSKHVLITGATSGIGYEIVRQLYDRATVSVIGRASPRLEALKTELPDLRVHEADLASPDTVAQAADAIVSSGETIDVLINNAAVQYTPQFLDDDFRLETIRREIDINLTAPSVLIYLTLPALLQSERAIILNINSGLGLMPKTNSAVYCATKGGLNILTQSLRNQLEELNIQVAQAFLPMVDTRMTEGRGTGKLTASEAAKKILAGLEGNRLDIDIGKVKFLRLLTRLSPAIARNIMRKG